MSDDAQQSTSSFQRPSKRGPLNSVLMRPGRPCARQFPFVQGRVTRWPTGSIETGRRRKDRCAAAAAYAPCQPINDGIWRAAGDALVTPLSRVSRPPNLAPPFALRAANTACAAARSSQKPSGLVDRTHAKGEGRPRLRPRRASARHRLLPRLHTVCVSAVLLAAPPRFACWHTEGAAGPGVLGGKWGGMWILGRQDSRRGRTHTWPLI